MACETLARQAYQLQADRSGSKVAICVDSQAAIKALASTEVKSTLVKECREALIALAATREVSIIWVPGHTNVEGNDLADLLARQGSDLHVSWAENIPSPVSFFRERNKKLLEEAALKDWRKSNNVASNIWQKFDIKSTRNLLEKGRTFVRKVIFLITGHWTIGRHARRLGITGNVNCPGCGVPSQETDIHHVWCMCPALCAKRMTYLGQYSVEGMESLKIIQLRDKLNFISNIRWF